jgi:hypothetical protein
MHQSDAIAYLEPLMKDKDMDVAQAATDAIRELKNIERMPVADQAQNVAQ